MTHQLLLNFDNLAAHSTYYPNLPDAYKILIRDVLEAMIVRHGKELWGKNQIMRGPIDLVRGSQTETLEAKSRRLSARVTAADIEAAAYDRQGVIDALVENVVSEFRAELATYRDNQEEIDFHPYQLLTPTGFIIAPDTGQGVATLMTRYATRPALRSDRQEVADDEPVVEIAIT